ncbi:MAG: sugar phosphate isomerase/epimerase family protein, partial [Cellulosilyticaceae bacterium]
MSNYTIVDWFGYNLSPRERMNVIKTAGFTGVILLWTDQFDPDYKDFPRYALEAGLYVENTHAPYIEANTLWQDHSSGEAYTKKLISCLEDCAVYDIPTLVMHPTNGKTPLPLTSIGIERLKHIIDKAETLNVNVALENMESPQYLEYIFSQIQSDRLGFCFDSGHQHL